MEQINHPHGGIDIHFWNNYMTFGTGGTFGAKLLERVRGGKAHWRGFAPMEHPLLEKISSRLDSL